MTEKLPTLAFIGAGAMGGAIIDGVLASGIAGPLRVSDADAGKVAALAERTGVRGFDAATPNGNVEAVRGAAVVVLAVKPDRMRDVLGGLRSALEPGTVLVSIAAGVTTGMLESLAPEGVRVVRVMPNLPALVRRGVTAVAAGSAATADDMALARRLFETVGEVVEVSEDQLDAVTSVSGSGPGYVFYLIEQFTAAAEHQGFSREQASTLVENTFRGAVELLAGSDKSAEQLRRQVTSPHGTTEAALTVLQEARLAELFERTTDAAVRRARELAAEA